MDPLMIPALIFLWCLAITAIAICDFILLCIIGIIVEAIYYD